MSSVNPIRSARSTGAGERVLVVEDDAKLLRALRRGLEREGYTVDAEETGKAALARASTAEYAVVVLDVVLPDVDGFTVCEALRRRERWVPVLMLTARSEVHDRIRGLDGGADDYMVKPFDFGELLARLRALSRRGPAEHPLTLTVGRLSLDRAAHTFTYGAHTGVLTAREFSLLETLAARAGEPVPRAELLATVWAGIEDVSPNVLDVYVGYVRKKLARGGGGRLIQTVRGLGFRLDTD